MRTTLLVLLFATTASAETLEERVTRVETELEAERKDRVVDSAYRSKAIRFGDDVEVDPIPVGDTVVWTNRRRWYPYVGELSHERIERPDFYRLVGRDDLARRYQRRRALAFAGIAGGLAVGVAGGFMYASDKSSPTAAVGLGLVGGGLVALAVGTYFALRMDPISEEDARELASDYNTQLRHDLRVAF